MGMDSHMKTTLEIDERVMRALKARAAQEGRTMSELVEAALRALLDGKRARPAELPELPLFDTGGWIPGLVEDRDRLHDHLEAERDQRLYGLRTGKRGK